MDVLRNLRAPLVLVIALGATAFVVAGCGDDESSRSSSTSAEDAQTIEVDGESATYKSTEPVSGDSIELEEDDYYFEPTVLTGDPGQKVTLDINNEGDNEHNLTIEDQGIDEDTDAGGTATVDVEIPKSGVVQFFCSYHSSQGMRGALAVTGSEPKPAAAGGSTETSTSSDSGGY